MSKIENAILAFLVCVIGLPLLYMLFVVLPITAHADAACQAAGYRGAKVTFGLTRYCYKLEHATDKVVPFEAK